MPINAETTSASSLIIHEDFKRAKALLDSGKNVLITGHAGTGKSTFLNWLRKQLTKNAVLLAPTGVAALNIRGQTIHSFFRFRHGFIPQDLPFRAQNRKLYERLRYLIIDEISMVRADMMDAIDRFLRQYGPYPGEAFGGVQLCLIGDLYQLPPVVTRDEEQLMEEHYETPYFFSSNAYKALPIEHVQFSRIFRQQDTAFINALNAIRHGQTDPETLNFFNQQSEVESTRDNTVTLTTTNNRADQMNHACLQNLPGQTYQFDATLEGNLREGQRYPAPEQLTLKEGAKVMLVRNDTKKRWVNGTMATVTALTERSITIELAHKNRLKNITLEPEVWEHIQYSADITTNTIRENVVGRYVQYPLMLAWAITIHKSQGKTLEHINLDLERGTFAPGQLYVALSRCRSLDDISLKRKLTARDVKTDPRITAFFGQFEAAYSISN